MRKKGWRRLLPRRRKEEKCPYIGHRKPFEKHLKEEGGRKRDENELRVVENNLVAFQLLAVTAEPLDRDAGIGRPKRRERTARLGYYPLSEPGETAEPAVLTR